jgi:hypothetical protein
MSLQDTCFFSFQSIFCFWSRESKLSNNLFNYMVHSDMNIITRGWSTEERTLPHFILMSEGHFVQISWYCERWMITNSHELVNVIKLLKLALEENEIWMTGGCKSYKIYWRILINNCRNLQDLLSAFIYPISTRAYQSFQEIDFIDSLVVSRPL